jgi:hypothetical protein
MISSKRTLVVLAGLAALVVPSQATINFSNLIGNNIGLNYSVNQMNATADNLIDFPHGAGTVTATGSFDIVSTDKIDALDVNEVYGFVYNGTIGLTVDLYNGTTVGSGIETVLYNNSVTGGILGATLTPSLQNNIVDFKGPQLITLSASFVGAGPTSLGYLGGFAIDGYEAVPEPAAYATLGIGIIGLLARRRRSRK